MSMRQGLVLWMSATLTAATILGIVWMVFRSELDAARTLTVKVNETQEDTLRLLEDNRKLAEDIRAALRRTVEDLQGQIGNELRAAQTLTRQSTATYESVTEAMKWLEQQQTSITLWEGAIQNITNRQDRLQTDVNELLTQQRDSATVWDAAIQSITHQLLMLQEQTEELQHQQEANATVWDAAIQSITHRLNGLQEDVDQLVAQQRDHD